MLYFLPTLVGRPLTRILLLPYLTPTRTMKLKLAFVGCKWWNMVAEIKSFCLDAYFTLSPVFHLFFFTIQLEAGIFIRLPLHSGLVTLSRKNIQKISEKSFKPFHSDDILFDRTEGELVSNSHWHRLKVSLLKYTLKEDRPTCR